MRGAVCGAAVFEGWAETLDDAAKAAAAGAFAFHPNHHSGAVGPMTGMTTASQPVLIVENRTFGNRAYCTINEGLGRVMRFGGNDREVIDRLRWIARVLAPALAAALQDNGGVPLKNIIARGLAMGDEMHQRNVACSALLLRELAPSLARSSRDAKQLAEVFAFIGRNDQFFLNVAMATGKAMTDPSSGIESSSLVTAMCRNGTDFGIRVAGTGERWYTAPVEMPVGLYFPGYSEKDANPDMGDSAIVETIGLGGFAMAAAPAVAGFVGAGSQSGMDDPRARLRRRADGDRHPQGVADRQDAVHQYGDRAQGGRRRPGRRRHRPCAARLLRARARRPRRAHGHRVTQPPQPIRGRFKSCATTCHSGPARAWRAAQSTVSHRASQMRSHRRRRSPPRCSSVCARTS
jgi:hypothetical protein